MDELGQHDPDEMFDSYYTYGEYAQYRINQWHLMDALEEAQKHWRAYQDAKRAAHEAYARANEDLEKQRADRHAREEQAWIDAEIEARRKLQAWGAAKVVGLGLDTPEVEE